MIGVGSQVFRGLSKIVAKPLPSTRVCELASSCRKKREMDPAEEADEDNNYAALAAESVWARPNSDAARATRSPSPKQPSASEKLVEKLPQELEYGEHLTVFQAYELAARYGLPPGHVTQAWRLYKRYDSDGHGKISPVDFQLLLRHVLRERYPAAKDVPRALLTRALDRAQAEVSFPEFLAWISENAFSENVLLSEEQRFIRRIAREVGCPVAEVEAIKHEYDRCAKGQKLAFDEFCTLLCLLLGIKEIGSLPDSRVRGFWRELDSGNRGAVEFGDFIPWYLMHFNPQHSRVGPTPFEHFYRNIRPTPFQMAP